MEQEKTLQQILQCFGGIDQQLQAQLADMQGISKYNKGFKYIVTVIDKCSKYSCAIPLINNARIKKKRDLENPVEISSMLKGEKI